jgi:DUF4097 and DUF4098 domain-containing protein YvlB
MMSDQETYQRGRETGSTPYTEPAGVPTMPAPATPLPNEPYYRQNAPPERSRRGMNLGMALILIGLVWLALTVGEGTLFGGALNRMTLVNETLSGDRIELDVGSADVKIRPWDKPDVQVQAFQQGGSRGDYSVDIRESDGMIYVTETSNNSFCFFCWRSLTLEIMVPKDLQATARTGSGDIDVEGIDGPASFSTGSGDIQASDLAGGATFNTGSGDVQLNHVVGKLEVSTSSGDVELDDGQVTEATVNTTSGDIDLEGVAETIKLESVSGDIRVREAREAQITASTTSGDVDYDGSLSAGGSNLITTISGDVKLQLPDDSGFRLDASTVSGDLSSDFTLSDGQQSRRSLSGRAGDGSATVRVETTSGSVSISR